MREITVPVLIVGGGGAGMTSSILLSDLGIRSLLVERRPDTSELPKAHILNQPTMEILCRAGVAGDVYQRSTPIDNMSRVEWRTSLTGATPLHGREIGAIDSWGGGRLLDEYVAASPCLNTNLPQLRLEPILRRHAEERAPDAVRFGHEVTGLTQDADRVRATIVDHDSGEEYVVVAQYMLGADAGRTVNAAIGVAMEGERDLADMVSTHFSADLSPWIEDDRIIIHCFINPDGAGSIGSGVLVKMGPERWDRHSEEWVFHCAVLPNDPSQFDTDTMLLRLRNALGIPDFDPTIHKVSHWRVEGVLADRYREGRVFILGDAAHRHPPTTGLGLNTAIQDAANLAWKLALVLRGQAPARLLETYEAERRAAGAQAVHRAMTTFMLHANIDAAIGLHPEQSVDEGWTAITGLYEQSPAGEERRAAVAAAIANETNEFSAHGVELGPVYVQGAIAGDDAPLQQLDDPVHDYQATTRPGHRVPHAWLERDGSDPTSTLDLPGSGRFVLITGSDDEGWQQAAAGLDLDVQVARIGGTGGWRDRTGAWAAQREVDDSGAVLVRPDGRVAWRAMTAPDDHSGALRAGLTAASIIPAAHTRTRQP